MAVHFSGGYIRVMARKGLSSINVCCHILVVIRATLGKKSRMGSGFRGERDADRGGEIVLLFYCWFSLPLNRL